VATIFYLESSRNDRAALKRKKLSKQHCLDLCARMSQIKTILREVEQQILRQLSRQKRLGLILGHMQGDGKLSHDELGNWPNLAQENLLVIAARADDWLSRVEMDLIDGTRVTWQLVQDTPCIGIPNIHKVIR